MEGIILNSPAACSVAQSNNLSSAAYNARRQEKFCGRQKSLQPQAFGLVKILLDCNGLVRRDRSLRKLKSYSLRLVASNALRSEVGSIGFCTIGTWVKRGSMLVEL